MTYLENVLGQVLRMVIVRSSLLNFYEHKNGFFKIGGDLTLKIGLVLFHCFVNEVIIVCCVLNQEHRDMRKNMLFVFPFTSDLYKNSNQSSSLLQNYKKFLVLMMVVSTMQDELRCAAITRDHPPLGVSYPAAATTTNVLFQSKCCVYHYANPMGEAMST